MYRWIHAWRTGTDIAQLHVLLHEAALNDDVMPFVISHALTARPVAIVDSLFAPSVPGVEDEISDILGDCYVFLAEGWNAAVSGSAVAQWVVEELRTFVLAGGHPEILRCSNRVLRSFGFSATGGPSVLSSMEAVRLLSNFFQIGAYYGLQAASASSGKH